MRGRSPRSLGNLKVLNEGLGGGVMGREAAASRLCGGSQGAMEKKFTCLWEHSSFELPGKCTRWHQKQCVSEKAKNKSPPAGGMTHTSPELSVPYALGGPLSPLV